MRLQAVLWSVTKRASELGVLLVHYSKPVFAQKEPTNGSVAGFEQIEELMFCWHPTKEELNHWVESKEREFAEKENKSPRLTHKGLVTKTYLHRPACDIFCDLCK